MSRLMTILAFATLAGFLGILIYEVPRIDLGSVIVVVLLLAAYDLLVPHGPQG